MQDDIPIPTDDDHDDSPHCPECRTPMLHDWEGDPEVINGTRDFWTCPECGESYDDPDSPLAVTEAMFRFARENGLM